MPKESRIALFRSLIGLAKDQVLIGALLKHVADISDDETEEERRCLIRFVLNFVAGTLVTQNFTPADLKEDLKRIDFENPLLKQDAQGNWGDFSGPKSGVQILGAELGRLIESDLKNFKYCNVSSFDYAFVSEAFSDPDVYDDFEQLIELEILPKSVDINDYAYFSWAAYMYPEFLLIAYANPSNEFTSPITYEHETQWSSDYDSSSELLHFVPSGLVEILWYRPRILMLLSSKKLAKHFDEFVDHWINLFPILEISQLSENEIGRNEVIQAYISDVENAGLDAQLDQYLDDDRELTKFFTIAGSCLYSNNSQLLHELSKIDDEVTRLCVMLNPRSHEGNSNSSHSRSDGFTEKFETSIIGDKFASLGDYIEEISRIADLCRDFELVEFLRNR
jgi:hypothetical protein